MQSCESTSEEQIIFIVLNLLKYIILYYKFKKKIMMNILIKSTQ
jgi:hypothetical protein